MARRARRSHFLLLGSLGVLVVRIVLWTVRVKVESVVELVPGLSVQRVLVAALELFLVVFFWRTRCCQRGRRPGRGRRGRRCCCCGSGRPLRRLC